MIILYRLDKCTLNVMNMYLVNMFIFGTGPRANQFDRSTNIDNQLKNFTRSKANDCRGYLSADKDGVAYSFTLQDSLTDCNALVFVCWTIILLEVYYQDDIFQCICSFTTFIIQENGTHIKYTNVVRGFAGRKNNLISRERPFEVEFSCIYKRYLLATTDFQMNTFIQ